MIVSLEAFPILGITDIKVPGLNFTIDWTGIPIVIVFMAFGFVYSLLAIAIMWISIAFRNFPGAAFKGFAELFRILGITVGWVLLRNRAISYGKRLVVYAAISSFFSAIGMYVVNILLLPLFYGIPFEIAVATSVLYIPWNILQALVNTIGGGMFYKIIPEDLRIAAGFKDYESLLSSEMDSPNAAF
jgi:riboflavin transporter FmnP